MKIAVVGGGITGLGAALLLQQKHEVHLFESASRLGGHAHTYSVQEDGRTIPIDVGFLVYNELTYPHFTQMLKYLNVQTCASDMSLSIRSEIENLEWAGDNLKTVFAQKRNLLRPQFLKMLKDVLRFHREAEGNYEMSVQNNWTLADLLSHGKYSDVFARWYLLPMAGAIWSTSEQNMMHFPAESFFNFCRNHRMLQVEGRPQWRTIVGGSQSYVKSIASRLAKIYLSSRVESAVRTKEGIFLQVNGQESHYDHVVFATHAPVTKKILRNQSAQEDSILGAFAVQPNLAVLHHDASDMPKRKSCWASWNVLVNKSSGNANPKMELIYYLNRLQPLNSAKDRFVTLNPISKIRDPDQSFQFDHPYFDQKSLKAQRELGTIQGAGGVYYAGAWTRFGFHEDGLLSAVNVAKLLGIETPWSVA
jgi:predicted NAD/FAD-binding protein